MALLGTLLVEEDRTPELMDRFRERLSRPRRRALLEALRAGVDAGELSEDLDLEVAVNMLIGSYYARHVSHGRIPADWSRRALDQVWPQHSTARH
jgi:hypothetical protein